MTQQYRRWIKLFMPASLQTEVASRLAELYALVTDLLVETMTSAVYASSLASGQVAADAMTLIGNERGMPRYPTETDFSYNARLLSAWTAYTYAGTDPSLLAQYTALGLTGYVRDMRRWTWDANAAWWSRMWVVFTDHPYAEWTLSDDITLDDTTRVIGLDASPAAVALMRAIARRWKPGHIALSQLIFVLNPTLWAAEQPDGTWDDDTQRSLSAAYIEA